MVYLIVVLVFVAMAVVGFIVERTAESFGDTGYNERCFHCKKTICDGCPYINK